LGLQLLCEFSEEGNTQCLGIFHTKVKKFEPQLKVPHMGWNSLTNSNSVLYENILLEEDCYFVHSFYAEICEQTTAVCEYIVPFSASLEKNNFYATQFHPEKSATVGEQILLNFLKL
jgi:glutamine amidotransferase